MNGKTVVVKDGYCNGCKFTVAKGGEFATCETAKVAFDQDISGEKKKRFLISKRFVLTGKGRQFPLQPVQSRRETFRIWRQKYVVMNRKEFKAYVRVKYIPATIRFYKEKGRARGTGKAKIESVANVKPFDF